MQLRMWTYDLAREQVPTLDHLRRLSEMSLNSGYNALGLYLEHRFAYPSAKWVAGKGALTPEMVKILESEFPELQFIPFLNLLGHFEGLLNTEGGQKYAEEKFLGMQACPSRPEVAELANRLIGDAIECFASQIIHIGADETGQLGKCPICSERVASIEREHPGADGKAILYGEYFAPLADAVLDAGRRPAMWGDMFQEHETALPIIPRDTLIFDWQYFDSPKPTAKKFAESGFKVVVCPTLFTYSAAWCHLAQSELNIRQNIHACRELGLHGVCVATWECELFGNYETMLPAISAAGKMLSDETVAVADETGADYPATVEAPSLLRGYLKQSETYEEWARLMGIELQTCGGPFSYSSYRSGIKCRFLLYSNPFLLWLRHGEELCGAPGDRALEVLDRAISVAPDSAARGVSEFVRIAIEFARHAEAAHVAYAAHQPGAAAAALAPARSSFDDLARIARGTNLRIGGSLADIERCRAAKEHVERVMRRIKEFGDGSLGYLPSFEMLSHPRFVPHDQGGWWLINDFAIE